jgi:hypothetical protein
MEIQTTSSRSGSAETYNRGAITGNPKPLECGE